MLKMCCACKRNTVDPVSSFHLCKMNHDYLLCLECQAMLEEMPRAKSNDDLSEIKSRFIPLLRDPHTPDEALDVIRRAEDAYWDAKESSSALESAYNNALENLMLTTGSSFDQYTVVKYLDIISSEIVFKNSFMSSLSANFEDLLNGLSFKEREMSGATRLIEQAKKYVMDKFRKKAIDLGANAILGIDFENSWGAEVIRISVNGTAVVVDRND